ncbi:TatD family hydrolase [Salegentibacter mishustinae]|uniref:Hydrolase TatD n=1 Tax=Salegentibacter mishustinae TaxID=270918 RepID=A0A0Q9ZI82_9FLAO|nr:TatD family hydrolase [Salegentibacter mishustinae]KRG27891.1 hydrolase TatD [Salegentibacter mishustinae]PNW20959.1 hydrolase TatD [Salegentibacter mishustinae]PZX64022.1 TatD DNase family protein [Salegentibacter mishustinae]GGW89632.1 TatD family hydrolase [Salegentibacter mishustinae]
MILTDTHIHLYSEDYEDDRDELIENAFKQNIERFFLPAIDSETTQSMYDLEARYPENVFLMMGLHPTHVQENFEDELKHVEEQFGQRRFYAVGEIGIDLHWDKSTLEIQQEAFRRQIKLAKKHKLPIVIHCRKAFDEIFEILEEEKSDDLFGIFHCFTGNLEQAKRALSYNLKLGIGGVVTFKNGKIDKFLNEIPLKEIVLETDGPYLSPSPFRGKRNQPEYLLKVAEKIAEIYQKPLAEIAEVTTQNSKDIFGI